MPTNLIIYTRMIESSYNYYDFDVLTCQVMKYLGYSLLYRIRIFNEILLYFVR